MQTYILCMYVSIIILPFKDYILTWHWIMPPTDSIRKINFTDHVNKLPCYSNDYAYNNFAQVWSLKLSWCISWANKKKVAFIFYVIALYVPAINISCKCHIYSLVYMQIWGPYVNIYMPHNIYMNALESTMWQEHWYT